MMEVQSRNIDVSLPIVDEKKEKVFRNRSFLQRVRDTSAGIALILSGCGSPAPMGGSMGMDPDWFDSLNEDGSNLCERVDRPEKMPVPPVVNPAGSGVYFADQTAEWGMPTAVRATGSSVYDLNRDGREDLISHCDYSSCKGETTIFFQCDKEFIEVALDKRITGEEPPLHVLSTAVEDFNGDGKPDILFAGDRNRLILLKNMGRLHFQGSNAIRIPSSRGPIRISTITTLARRENGTPSLLMGSINGEVGGHVQDEIVSYAKNLLLAVNEDGEFRDVIDDYPEIKILTMQHTWTAIPIPLQAIGGNFNMVMIANDVAQSRFMKIHLDGKLEAMDTRYLLDSPHTSMGGVILGIDPVKKVIRIITSETKDQRVIEIDSNGRIRDVSHLVATLPSMNVWGTICFDSDEGKTACALPVGIDSGSPSGRVEAAREQGIPANDRMHIIVTKDSGEFEDVSRKAGEFFNFRDSTGATNALDNRGATTIHLNGLKERGCLHGIVPGSFVDANSPFAADFKSDGRLALLVPSCPDDANNRVNFELEYRPSPTAWIKVVFEDGSEKIIPVPSPSLSGTPSDTIHLGSGPRRPMEATFNTGGLVDKKIQIPLPAINQFGAVQGSVRVPLR